MSLLFFGKSRMKIIIKPTVMKNNEEFENLHCFKIKKSLGIPIIQKGLTGFMCLCYLKNKKCNYSPCSVLTSKVLTNTPHVQRCWHFFGLLKSQIALFVYQIHLEINTQDAFDLLRFFADSLWITSNKSQNFGFILKKQHFWTWTVVLLSRKPWLYINWILILSPFGELGGPWSCRWRGGWGCSCPCASWGRLRTACPCGSRSVYARQRKPFLLKTTIRKKKIPSKEP